ncbi:sensor histidine kinase [Croceicoccus marinus]|uniref:histidine kinase n=1 Tax=Croceicoccus marinus TaxID=450378 RepID=A0A7G6VRK2_9SPHN|nr:HAMP domain-containing sensor histidine kinase [Croceicoccus marinus]QNE04367.1 HAMP domain-containing histidine kinase [Croceicoccus marinus]
MAEGTLAATGATAALTARSDAQDRLVAADQRLLVLQRECGGDMPGLIAVPELMQLVRKSRAYGMKLAQALTVTHPGGSLKGWAEIEPDDDGCTIRLSDWHAMDAVPATGDQPAGTEDDEATETRLAIEQLLAEAVLWLDGQQNIVALETECTELSPMVARARRQRGQNWSTLFQTDGDVQSHWSLRSGIIAGIEESERRWHLMLTGGTTGNAGQQILIRRHEEPISAKPANDEDLLPGDLLSQQLAPALDAPVRRIIQLGEIMRDRLAGPLSREYVSYAGDIVDAARHLAGLAQSLSDGEDEPEPDMVALVPGEIAESACRFQTTRAARKQARFTIAFDPARALGDRRWCMQILLNLLGNAVDYGPRGGEIFVDCAAEGPWVSVSVTDEGKPLSAQDCEKIFAKYERLGREGDGTGLGLHIARRLAEAMGGSLTVSPGKRGGNCFTLRLKAADEAEAAPE